MNKIFNNFSFEFFPAKTILGNEKLLSTAKNIATNYRPAFFSCTYGAGGSTRESTFSTVININKNTNITTIPHLSCVGDDKENIRNLLKKYRDAGIFNIIALRGDFPSGIKMLHGDIHYANELVEFIRHETGEHFYIYIAAYPEIHPQANNYKDDLNNFVRKAKAGANSAITQFFFNIDSYFYFVEKIRRTGLDIPILPGIMPITNYEKLLKVSHLCGTEIPRWMRKQFEAYGNDINSICAFGEQIISQMCENLLLGGAPGLHFYTLNKPAPILSILKNIGI